MNSIKYATVNVLKPSQGVQSHLHGQVVVLVQVVSHRKVDPVVAITGLQQQDLVPALHKAAQVAQLDLHARM